MALKNVRWKGIWESVGGESDEMLLLYGRIFDLHRSGMYATLSEGNNNINNNNNKTRMAFFSRPSCFVGRGATGMP